MDAEFLRITPCSRSVFYFTYEIFLEGPGCVIGGGMYKDYACWQLCNWTGWTGCMTFWGNRLRVGAV